jgi:hypothetical protein
MFGFRRTIPSTDSILSDAYDMRGDQIGVACDHDVEASAVKPVDTSPPMRVYA